MLPVVTIDLTLSKRGTAWRRRVGNSPNAVVMEKNYYLEII
jgi:hypothetical protein